MISFFLFDIFTLLFFQNSTISIRNYLSHKILQTPSTSFSIDLKLAGKIFFRNWIFKNLSLSLQSPQKISVLGANGSGKSTLLQIVAGYESLSEGTIQFLKDGKEILRENIFNNVSIASPYLEVVEEYTLMEIIKFHFQFKKPVQNLSSEEIISLTELEASKDKVFKYFSSGMKQRAKLALAILSDVDLVLLDEPLSNLDKGGEQWYHNLAEKFLRDKAVFVCSNQNESEYFFCDRSVNISDYR